MFVVTPKQMSEIDKTTIEQIGIPGIVLMENAAIKVVREIEKDLGSIKGKSFLIIAGKGNNGGDALAVARHLFNMGGNISVYTTVPCDDIQGDARTNLRILNNMGIGITEAVNEERLRALKESLQTSDLVIDGIFGTGLKGTIRGVSKDIIEAVNDSGKPVISIDIPSGINGETGKVAGISIQAYKTVTFGLPKLGLILHPGCEFCGELVVADIGFPKKVVESFNIKSQIIDAEYVGSKLPRRRRNTNKGNYGKLLIITGSKGMTGAGSLSAKAALRTGTGLVYLGVPESLVNVYDLSVPEAVTVALAESNPGYLGFTCLNNLDKQLSYADAVAVGPGLSVTGEIRQLVEHIIKSSSVPLVLDADALNALSQNINVLRDAKTTLVLTPHPGEMSRITGLTIDEIQSDRIGIAKHYANLWNVILVLKGSVTVVAWPDGSIFLNTTGNSGMATAGSGDVLTGMIASLIGQGVSPANAAVAGVFLHGLAGDKAAELKGEYGLVAGDIVDNIPKAIMDIIKD